MPLCRRSRLSVARLSPYRDLCPHRPHQEARRPQGQEDRRAGISVDRKCLGARDPAGRLRGEAVRCPLVAWRHRGAGRPEKITIKLPPDVSFETLPPERPFPTACLPKARSTASCAPGSTLRRARSSERRLAISRPDGCRGRTITSAPAFSRSCISLVCVAPWSSSTPGFPRRYQGLRTGQGRGTALLERYVRHQGDAAFRRRTIEARARPDGASDFWSYGVAANRKVLDTFLHHHHLQGLSSRKVTVDELFHPTTFEAFKL